MFVYTSKRLPPNGAASTFQQPHFNINFCHLSQFVLGFTFQNLYYCQFIKRARLKASGTGIVVSVFALRLPIYHGDE